MGLSLVETGSPPLPAVEPVSVEETKQFCDIDGNDRDGQVAGHIFAARSMAESFMRRAIVTQTWDFTADRDWPHACVSGVWQQCIELPLPPLQSVTDITYIDGAGATQTLAPSDYVVRRDGVVGRVVPAYGVTWPAVRDQVAAITVRFVAGWEPEKVPDPIRNAVLLQVKALFDMDPNHADILERAVESLLGPYRIMRIPS